MPVLPFPWRREARAPVPDVAPLASGPQPLLAAALEFLPDAILIVRGDKGGRSHLAIAASNLAAQELFRLRNTGETLVTVLRNPEILGAAEQTFTVGEPQTLTFETGGPQSRVFRVWTRALPDGDSTCVLIVLRDETEARRIERMRADFLANASHELRTPLASVTGFIETLQGHAKDDPEARNRFLGIMAEQAKRMGRLIDDLLSLSRIEMNEHVAPSGVCDIALVAREVIDGLLPAVCARRVGIELDAPFKGDALAVGERDQIVQILQNLIDNAVKYAPDGSTITVTVTAAAAFETDPESAGSLREAGGGRMALLSPERAHERRYVLVRIADCGPGIAREHLPRLTERFYRVPGQKSGDVTGTGLGLAIVKHLTNRHRGGLVVESAPAQGTVFSVFLPAATGENENGRTPDAVVTKAL